MQQKVVSAFLIMTLLLPEVMASQAGPRHVATATSPAPPASAVPAQNSTQTPTSERPQSTSRRRSYERETHPRRRSGISKKEVAVLAGIAGTSMGIGALAGGAKGLAIGAIVGGWGAYAGHRLWRWIR